MTSEIGAFSIGDEKITDVKIKKLSFLEFVAAVGNKTTSKDYQRARIRAMVTLNGKEITDDQIASLPIAVGKKIVNQIDNVDDAIGGEKVEGSGDGINGPALFKLGTPLKMLKSGKEVLITELEFLAKTYGDVEDIIAAPSSMSQTAELIKKLATPVGISGLQILPETLQKQISVVDGIKMAIEILPPFVE